MYSLKKLLINDVMTRDKVNCIVLAYRFPNSVVNVKVINENFKDSLMDLDSKFDDMLVCNTNEQIEIFDWLIV